MQVTAQSVAEVVTSKKFPVIETFGPTLQGEGASIGVQTMFIRFGGCDYRCTSCDSLHAVLPKLVKQGATWMTEEEIFQDLKSKAGELKTVTLSGGNPCMWDIGNLIQLLRMDGWTILLETQGTLWQPWVYRCSGITISPKGPGMGEKFEPEKLERFIEELEMWGIYSKVSLKIVIFTQLDIEFAKAIRLQYQTIPMFLSLGNPWPPEPAKRAPLEEGDLRIMLLERMVSLYQDIKQESILHNCVFLPQMHVLLWGNERGK